MTHQINSFILSFLIIIKTLRLKVGSKIRKNLNFKQLYPNNFSKSDSESKRHKLSKLVQIKITNKFLGKFKNIQL
jgi:hypothetical protein